ncbi:MAG: hypothetical protein KDH89_17760, partial [Anaerolineae bacterium]|nr:hypothetical protein [Anaerolineae bacterium]
MGVATAEQGSGQEGLAMVRGSAGQVVRILKDWGADDTLLATALLGEFAGSGVVSENDVASTCGDEVAHLCRLYNTHLASSPASDRRDSVSSQSLACLFLAGYREPRLAIIGA